jgi:hypothetical protein
MSDNTDISSLISQAEQGEAEAQFKLGMAYANGDGISFDVEKAIHWFTKATDQGNADGQKTLDIINSAQQLAEQGDKIAQAVLAENYKNGKNVSRDLEKAKYWYTKAANNGHIGAKLILEQLAETAKQDNLGTNKETESNGEPIIVPGENFVEKLIWLNSNVQNNGNYTIEINANESIGPGHNSLSYGNKSNITITLKGVGSNNRTIALSFKGKLFNINKGIILILDNITLRGRKDNDRSLVLVDGTLIMNEGSAIIDNVFTPSIFSWGGGVCVMGSGTFIMNNGIISGNTSSEGGGVHSAGIFIMKGGTISCNTATNNGMKFNGMKVGTSGGGVYITYGTFTKTGGTITGYTSDTINGNKVIDDGRIADYSWLVRFGHAIKGVSTEKDIYKCKDTTVGPTDNMSFDSETGYATGVWNGKVNPTDPDPSSNSSGCYVATCVYGSYDCPEVWTLRRFRDNELSSSWLGRLFIRFYYAVSPKIVELFGGKKWFSRLWKPIINKIVCELQNRGVD